MTLLPPEIELAAKGLEALDTAIKLYQQAKNPNRLGNFARLMAQPDNDDRAQAIRQFLQDLTQERGFTPWYEYREAIEVPKDLLCDLVDLLVKGATIESKAGWLGGLVGTDAVQADRLHWAVEIKDGLEEPIIAGLENLVARAGRVRSHAKAGPTISVDLDWLADAGMALIG